MMAGAALLLLSGLFASATSALQVTPNSPCASFCLDNNDLDFSDPGSSNTKGSDITCNDGDYVTNTAGQKFQRCLTCLQDSTFAQGEENDQQWFLYNLRYSFDYCIFGFPNATDVGSSPCQTSTACGALEAALKDGELDPRKSKQYSYCSAPGSSITGDGFDKCLQCVKASRDHRYLANFLLALKAGCKQLPAPGSLVGLNDTVFSYSMIQIVDPSDGKKDDDKNKPKLPATHIAIIAVAGFVAVLVAAGCIFVQYRKRKFRKHGREDASRDRRTVSSSLSFQCQTHLTPMEASYVPGMDDESSIDEKPFAHPAEALGSNPVSPSNHSPTESKPNLWNPHNAVPRSPTKELNKPPFRDSIPAHRGITITLPTQPPTAAHPSPRLKNSPYDDYATPTSAQSTAPLLPIKPYVPADFGTSSPSLGPAAPFSPASRYASPTSATTASPLLSQGSWPLPVTASPARETPRGFPAVSRVAIRPGAMRSLSGSPVETRTIQTSFPGPPRR